MNQFNNTKYTRWYYDLINHRISNPVSKNTYRESHHIIPESFFKNRKRDGIKGWIDGNPDSKSNKVWLTAREHALCHWLLIKMTTHNQRAYELMIYSFNMMKVSGYHQDRESSRMITRAYERNRIEWSRIHSKNMYGKDPWNKGYVETRPDVLARVKQAANDRPKLTDEKLKEKVRKSVDTMKKNGTDKRSQETKSKMSNSQKGIPKPKSQDWKDAVSKTALGKSKPIGHGAKVANAVLGNISINKDGIEKKVKEHQLQDYLNDDWKLGGRPRKKK
jgi:hypothetical protein